MTTANCRHTVRQNQLEEEIARAVKIVEAVKFDGSGVIVVD